MSIAQDQLAAAFESNRPHLVRVAYATLGSIAEAEDVVQEAWLRLRRTAEEVEVRDLRAWLTTVVARLALDALGSARARRETYVGPWLPEPVIEPIAAEDPAERVALDESVELALLIVLERLSPAERTAFLLHDVFGMTFAEAGEVLGRSAAATRQLAARARRHVTDGRPRFPPTPTEQNDILIAFTRACSEGDLDGLLEMLDEDVVWRSDGGGNAIAARRAQHGAPKVARGMIALARRPARSGYAAHVNGSPGLVMRDADGFLTVIALTIDAGSIVAIDVIRNPDKLTAVPEPAVPEP